MANSILPQPVHFPTLKSVKDLIKPFAGLPYKLAPAAVGCRPFPQEIRTIIRAHDEIRIHLVGELRTYRRQNPRRSIDGWLVDNAKKVRGALAQLEETVNGLDKPPYQTPECLAIIQEMRTELARIWTLDLVGETEAEEIARTAPAPTATSATAVDDDIDLAMKLAARLLGFPLPSVAPKAKPVEPPAPKAAPDLPPLDAGELIADIEAMLDAHEPDSQS